MKSNAYKSRNHIFCQPTEKQVGTFSTYIKVKQIDLNNLLLESVNQTQTHTNSGKEILTLQQSALSTFFSEVSLNNTVQLSSHHLLPYKDQKNFPLPCK